LGPALAAGALSRPDEAAEIGEIADGRRPGRTSSDQITVCDLTGVGVQDVAAALLVLDRCGDAGQRLEV
ncbi:MAG: ornithine cyclodeaminase family protein, partial [Halobacteriales archaeon]|nr:ornithine cyclodeaminase family protein [Halobacteriales archaeon]